MRIIKLPEKLYNINIIHSYKFESFIIADNNSSENYKNYKILIENGIYNLHHVSELDVYVYMTSESRNKLLKNKVNILNGR